ncbi:MAG: GyrI-like domain-containing protein [Proteobacteria bacterium]|nr:GyrI-like domain-containing protein [Pseudomonadota bacterium]
MKQAHTTLPEKKLIGIQVRTNNQTEIDPMTGKIFPIVRRYFHEQLAEKIPNRTKPGTTFCCYTDYESDHHGDYTYFIGEEVDSLNNVPADFETLIIPAQSYAKFTTLPAPMPDVVRNAWFSIWKMTESDLGGKRRYATDFEIYDERASDHQKIVMDLFIGIV